MAKYTKIGSLLLVLFGLILFKNDSNNSHPLATGNTFISPDMDIISHRGAAGLAPENTLAGIDSALKYKVPFIEIDVRMTADGSIILMHDQTVNRTTNGKGKVGNMGFDEIAGLDAGSYFSNAYRTERVPLLKEVLKKIKPTPTILVIEVKSPKRSPRMAKSLLELIESENAHKNVVVASFDHDFVGECIQLNSQLKTCLLSVFPPRKVKQTQVKYLSINWRTFSCFPSRVKKLKKQGYSIWAWTVNKPKHFKKMEKHGIDGIVTDYPNLVMTLSEE